MSGGMPGSQVSGDVLRSLGTPQLHRGLAGEPLSISAASIFGLLPHSGCFHISLLPHSAASTFRCFHILAASTFLHFYISTASTFLHFHILHFYCFHTWLGSIESTVWSFQPCFWECRVYRYIYSNFDLEWVRSTSKNIKTSHSSCCSRRGAKNPILIPQNLWGKHSRTCKRTKEQHTHLGSRPVENGICGS